MKKEALLAVLRSARWWTGAYPRFSGTADEIAAAIVERTWNGTFFQTGVGHFDYFWMRDFGTVAEALMRLGKQQEVHATVHFALTSYMASALGVTTCISRGGKPFDLPMRSIDSLPWLLRTCSVCGMSLSDAQRAFLQKQLHAFVAEFLNKHDGLPKRNGRYAELRDVVHYSQSAYAITMVSVLMRSARELGLEVPPQCQRAYGSYLIDSYWNGTYLRADANTDAFSAECNLFPLWLGVIDDADVHNRVLEYIVRKGIAEPYPVVYTDQPDAFRYRWWHCMVGQYGGRTIWPWHGFIYLVLLKAQGRPEFAQAYQAITALIEQHQTVPELLQADGSLYRSVFYRSETGMVWAALFLGLNG